MRVTLLLINYRSSSCEGHPSPPARGFEPAPDSSRGMEKFAQDIQYRVHCSAPCAAVASFATWLSHDGLDCHTTVSLYCHTTVSLHCHTTASLDCHTTVSLDCHTTVSLYCHTAVSISQLHVARVIVLCFAFCTKCVCFFSSTNTALRWKRNFLPISQWRSQLGGSNFWLRQATIICFGYRLPKRKMTGYSQNFGGPLGLRLCYFCGASLASSRSSLTFESFVIKTVTVEFFVFPAPRPLCYTSAAWWLMISSLWCRSNSTSVAFKQK